MCCKSVPLDDGYTAEFDNVEKEEWYKIIDHFSDSNIYQTWSYDAIRCGKGNISHFVLRLDGKIVAAAQARIIRLPVLGFGAAYVRWGPMWQLRNQVADPIVFRMALRALRNEFVCRRRWILRIFPFLYDDNPNLILHALLKEGFSFSSEKNASRTFLVNIASPVQELRRRFDQKWRNCLNRAERNNLQVVEGTEDHLFADFIVLYKDLLQRKKFEAPHDINEFRNIQKNLPLELKMRIFLCRSEGINTAGAIFTAIGETGLYLLGATNDQGMANKGSYLLQWKGIQWMKASGCLAYNLNGINPLKNPGTYHFKAGIAGKSGKDVYYLGFFGCYPNCITEMLARVFDSAPSVLKKILTSSRSHATFK